MAQVQKFERTKPEQETTWYVSRREETLHSLEHSGPMLAKMRFDTVDGDFWQRNIFLQALMGFLERGVKTLEDSPWDVESLLAA
ncbi:hypothetical protein Hypma_016411 [Hypsizygus marmoreus]|uniref:Uncharacterized protein n=1 Tax=Hypsizygus marmoreus TaxID=39966 RepID=A0A369J3A0_HYPMA|nr:hypothetical protein Hypma_016411 [Hypsizygus marmoreus]